MMCLEFMQEKAYACCIEIYNKDVDWIAFIDDGDKFTVMQRYLIRRPRWISAPLENIWF